MYKGKRADNGEWVYGGVTKSYKGFAVILGVDMTSKYLVIAETVESIQDEQKDERGKEYEGTGKTKSAARIAAVESDSGALAPAT